MTFVHAWSRAMARIAGVGVAFAAVLLVAMAALIVVEVTGRYLFGFSTLIADEYGEYMFVWMTFLGFAHTLRSGQFLSVDIAVRRFPPGARRIAAILAGLAGAAVTGVCVWASWRTVSISFAFQTASPQQSQTLLWMPQLVMPIGMAVLTLCFLEVAARAAVGLPADAAPASGASGAQKVHL